MLPKIGGRIMRHILVEIFCRTCGYHTHIKSHTLVQPELEPHLRERILHSTMFTYTCPHCHENITYIHNFLYHDTKRNFLVYMSADHGAPDELSKQFPTAKMASVNHPDALQEMIRIWEDDLDEQVLIRIKANLKKQDPRVKAIRYHDEDRSSHTLWLQFLYEEGTMLKAIERSAYDQYCGRLKRGGKEYE